MSFSDITKQVIEILPADMMSDVEKAKYSDACKEHDEVCSYRSLWLIPTPTGMGMHWRLKCVACKRSWDITDYGSW